MTEGAITFSQRAVLGVEDGASVRRRRRSIALPTTVGRVTRFLRAWRSMAMTEAPSMRP